MKAPDKIYMPNELLSEEWQRHIEGEDTCYIRKEALLEWAREKLEFCKKMILNGNPGFEFKLSIYEQFIDKLNSL